METEYVTEERTETLHRVTIEHVHIPFGEMVTLLVKFAFAVIPAALIVAAATAFAWFAFIAMMGANNLTTQSTKEAHTWSIFIP